MPLPPEWDDRILERTYLDDFGDPMTGTVTITAAVPVENMSETTVFYPRPRRVALDPSGKATITVQVADPDMRTSEYTHHVVEDLVYPEHEDLPTPSPVHVEYNILVEPGSDPMLYGAQAPVAPSFGQTLIDPLFQGPPGEDGADGAPGAPGAPGADGTDGTDGADGDSAYDAWLAAGNSGTQAQFLASLVGAQGPTGIGKSAYEEWQDDGHPGGTIAEFLDDLVDVSTLLPVKNGIVDLLPALDKFARLTVVDDSSDSSTWPNRFEIVWTQSGRPAHLTFWLNEFGEWRAIPAKSSTVAARIFVKDAPTDPDHDPDIPVFEVADNRTDRVFLAGIMPDGRVLGTNIGQKVVAQGTAPSDTTVIWVDTSA
jgi:hypothetical protein